MFLRQIVFRSYHLCHNPQKRCFRLMSSKVMSVNSYYRFKKKENVEVQQKFKHFLVLDFEATCDREYFPEMVLETFHKYVRPTKHPTLTPFCTQLTGICQGMVEDQPQFPEVLEMFLRWLRHNDFQFTGSNPDTIFVTSGDWDLLKMLPNQCRLSDLPVPAKMTSWINIKKAFLRSTGVYPRGIIDMLKKLDLQHEGKLHSGIDDCKNIVKIMQALAQRKFIFERTRSLIETS